MGNRPVSRDVLTRLATAAITVFSPRTISQRKPENVLAHVNLAITLARDERRDEAIAHVREAIRLDRRNAQWQDMLSVLRK